MAPVPSPPESVPTTDLLKQTVMDARQLVELEVRSATTELKQDLLDAKRAAIALGAALGIAVLVLGALLVAVILALGATVSAALLVAAALAALGVVCGAVAYAVAPKSLLKKTRRHVEQDAAKLKEHIA